MKKLSSIYICALIILAFSATGPHAKNRDLQIIHKNIEHGNVVSFSVRFGQALKKIELPKEGVNAKYFSAQLDKWNNDEILSVTLDERGQVPIIAYYYLSDRETCFIGKYALLSFDKDTSYVVEPRYSSASEQLINRYKYSHCKLTPYDQLIDKAASTGPSEPLKRIVTRVKGTNLPPYECEYEIRNGEVVDEKQCFAH